MTLQIVRNGGGGVKRALRAHPAAELFPTLSEREIATLAEDIRENGQTMPVVVWDDRNLVVDGRNRLAACESLGIEPRIERRAFPDDAAVARFIVSANIHRRHMSESQRATIGASLKRAFFAPAAKERQAHGATAPGRTLPANLPGASHGADAREEAAFAVNVSPRLIDAADDVFDRGAPELNAAVVAGELAVTAAASMLDRNHDEQRAILERVKTGKARSVRRAIAEIDDEASEQAAIAERPPASASKTTKPSRPQRDPKNPFRGLINCAEDSAATWRTVIDEFRLRPQWSNATVTQRKELIAALKSHVREANHFISWLNKEAARTKPS